MLFGKEVYSQLTEGDLLLCIDKETRYGEASKEMRSGDVLVMFTDGVVENMNQDEEEFSIKNLIRVVDESKAMKASRIVGQVLADLKDFMGGRPVTDEFTLAVVKLS